MRRFHLVFMAWAILMSFIVGFLFGELNAVTNSRIWVLEDTVEIELGGNVYEHWIEKGE